MPDPVAEEQPGSGARNGGIGTYKGQDDLNQWSADSAPAATLRGMPTCRSRNQKPPPGAGAGRWRCLGTGAWAGYRMLDPVEDYARGDAVCHSTGIPGLPPGIIATPFIEVKPGRWMDVRSIGLVDGVNYRLAGAGVQDQGAGIGALPYPVADDGSPESVAWLKRVALPATLGDASNESLIMALEPVDPSRMSSLRAVRVEYRNEWGIAYRVEVGPTFNTQPDCSVDPDGD